jgi:hypothetical protein
VNDVKNIVRRIHRGDINAIIDIPVLLEVANELRKSSPASKRRRLILNAT